MSAEWINALLQALALVVAVLSFWWSVRNRDKD